jgi:hypothetical protein
VRGNDSAALLPESRGPNPRPLTLAAVHSNPAVLNSYLASVENSSLRANVADYAKRVLSKLPEESEDEGDL